MLEFELAVGDRSGDHERAALDAIGNDSVFAPDEIVNAFDANLRRAVAFDLRAHLDQQFSTVEHFRLTGGADENGFAFSERRGAHDVDRTENRRALSAAEVHLAALQPAAHFADHVAVFDAELGPELLQPPNVQIYRPIADRAPTGQ